MPNYKAIATKVGELVKSNSATKNDIKRSISFIFAFDIEKHSNDAISADKARLIYDCILSLEKQEMNENDKHMLLIKFCREVCQDEIKINEILMSEGIAQNLVIGDQMKEYDDRKFHSLVYQHSRENFKLNKYLHAVFEVSKVYMKEVKNKANMKNNDKGMVMEAWDWDKNKLRVPNTEVTELSAKDYHEGLKHLSAGVVCAVRNPASHEPETDWKINKQDCLDILAIYSFLFRNLDKAINISQ